eukprot:9558224-Alexandrium_andersonii.AAC.1
MRSANAGGLSARASRRRTRPGHVTDPLTRARPLKAQRLDVLAVLKRARWRFERARLKAQDPPGAHR